MVEAINTEGAAMMTNSINDVKNDVEGIKAEGRRFPKKEQFYN